MLSPAMTVIKSSGCVPRVVNTIHCSVCAALIMFCFTENVPADPADNVIVGFVWASTVPTKRITISCGCVVFNFMVVAETQERVDWPETCVKPNPKGDRYVGEDALVSPAAVLLNCGLCSSTTYVTKISPNCVVLLAFIADITFNLPMS